MFFFFLLARLTQVKFFLGLAVYARQCVLAVSLKSVLASSGFHCCGCSRVLLLGLVFCFFYCNCHSLLHWSNLLRGFFLSSQDKFGKSLVEDFPNDFVVDLSPVVDGYAERWLTFVIFLLLRTGRVNTWSFQLSLSVFSCSSFLFPVKSLYNLDEDETQGAIAINLLPLVSQSEPGRVTDEMSNPRKRYFDIYLAVILQLREIYSHLMQYTVPRPGCLSAWWGAGQRICQFSVFFSCLLLDMFR